MSRKTDGRVHLCSSQKGAASLDRAMDASQAVLHVIALCSAGFIGWQVRRGVEPPPLACQCQCVCHCGCELGISSGTWLAIFLFLGLAAGLYFWIEKVPTDTTKSPFVAKGKKGIFGSTGKLSLGA